MLKSEHRLNMNAIILAGKTARYLSLNIPWEIKLKKLMEEIDVEAKSKTCTAYYYAVYKQILRKSYEITDSDERELLRLPANQIKTDEAEVIEFIPKREMTPEEKEFDGKLASILAEAERDHFLKAKAIPKAKKSIFQKISNFFIQ